MKKIVAAVAAGLMLASAAFADVGFTYTGYNYFKSSGGNLDYDTESHSDCLAIEISNETSGAMIDIDTDFASDNSNSNLKLDKYCAWMLFGGLKVTAGKFNSRWSNRVIADAGDLDAEDFELFKMGVVGSTEKTAADSDNMGLNTAITMLVDYTFADIGPGALLVKAGLIKSNGQWNPESVGAEDVKVNMGFALEGAYRINDTLAADLTIRSFNQGNNSIALFVSPLGLENIQLTLGGTLGLVSRYDTTAGEKLDNTTEFAVDLRARYRYSDTIAFTTMHNLSSYANWNATTNKYDDNELGLWDMLNVSYKMADNADCGLTLNSYVTDLSKKGSKKDADFVFDGVIVSPYVAIKASEKATVTVAVRGAWENLDPSTFKCKGEPFEITIPVLFSYSF